MFGTVESKFRSLKSECGWQLNLLPGLGQLAHWAGRKVEKGFECAGQNPTRFFILTHLTKGVSNVLTPHYPSDYPSKTEAQFFYPATYLRENKSLTLNLVRTKIRFNLEFPIACYGEVNFNRKPLIHNLCMNL